MTMIGQPPWMTEPAAAAVMTALHRRGGEDCARFVGGAVRNTLMGLAVDDVDIATRLTPDEVVAALATAGLKAIPTGIEHGTVTAIADHRPFEITTLRRDVTTDGRNATVAFTDDWTEDARRRDFRLNALYADIHGAVLDPTGEGVADAKAGRIVFVGDPQTRIREDYLRILRFFRFHGWYGKGEADAAALAACAALRGDMGRLSAERVQKELLKLLAAPNPAAALGLMAKTGVLAEILPEGGRLDRFETMAAIDDDPLLRLAALLPDDSRIAAAVAARLRLSNAMRDRLVAALTDGAEVSASMTEAGARRALYAIGWQAFADRLRLQAADGAASPDFLLQRLEGWTKPMLPVSGKDVLDLGVAAGPRVADLLREVERWWIDRDFPEDRSLSLSKLKTLIET
jgi:poly(A) polymerase